MKSQIFAQILLSNLLLDYGEGSWFPRPTTPFLLRHEPSLFRQEHDVLSTYIQNTARSGASTYMDMLTTIRGGRSDDTDENEHKIDGP